MKRILAEHPAPVPIVGEAGTAAIFHYNLMHASEHNLSHEDRRGVFMCYNHCVNRPLEVPEPRLEYVRGTRWEALGTWSDDAIPAAN